MNRIYGHPGDGIDGILGALASAEDRFEFVQVPREGVADFMACARALSSAPGRRAGRIFIDYLREKVPARRSIGAWSPSLPCGAAGGLRSAREPLAHLRIGMRLEDVEERIDVPDQPIDVGGLPSHGTDPIATPPSGPWRRRAGHSSVGFTLDRYSHVIPSLQEDAALRIDAALRKTLAGKGGKRVANPYLTEDAGRLSH